MFKTRKLQGEFDLLKSSSMELKSTRSLAGLGLLMAMNIIVGSLFIEINSYLRIGFSFLVVGICGYYYGPVSTGVAGAAADIIKYLLRPSGPFFPGFTLNEFIAGFITGIILYKKSVTMKRVFVTRLCVVVIVNIILTPLWLSVLYGKGIMVYVSARVIKNIILLPIDTIALYGTLKSVSRVRAY